MCFEQGVAEMTDTQKAYAVIAILGIWGILASLALTPMEQFVQVLRDALIGLGVFTATMSDPKK